ncbi:MAG TPA: histidine kinase [Thermoanaerobaculia bacterium]|nr:histidine kinase [Thermoanaerobaculia bacterium]
MVGAIALVLLPARSATLTLAWFTETTPEYWPSVLGSTLMLAAMLVPVPLVIGTIQSSAGWSTARRLLALTACALAYLGASGLMALLVAIIFVPAAVFEPPRTPLWMFAIGLPTSIIIYAMAVGIARAVQWYRASAAIESQRREIESSEILRTRRLLQTQYRPATIIDALRRIAGALPHDQPAAERLLHRLARYARLILRNSAAPRPTCEGNLRALRAALLLSGVPTTIAIDGGDDCSQEAGQDLVAAIEAATIAAAPRSLSVAFTQAGDHHEVTVRAEGESAEVFLQRLTARLAEAGLSAHGAGEDFITVRLPQLPERPNRPSPAPASAAPAEPLSMTLIVTIVMYGVVTVILDRSDASMSARLPFARILSLLALAPVGLLLDWISKRVARQRLHLALAGMALAGILLAAGVTAAVLAALNFLGIEPETPLPALLAQAVFLLTRNLLVFLALAAIAFAKAVATSLLERERRVGRLRDDVALAESRDIEAAFHPHFLFNALTSIASLIRDTPRRAAAMARSLSDLVEKSVVSAGVERWEISRELDLASDYLAIQKMRFASRIQVEQWSISASARRALVPRLLLQPLFENACKHAVAHQDRPTAMGLTVRKRGRRLVIALWNDDAHAPGPTSWGRGLTLVQRRVDAAAGTLEIDRGAGERFVVRCSIPQ